MKTRRLYLVGIVLSLCAAAAAAIIASRTGFASVSKSPGPGSLLQQGATDSQVVPYPNRIAPSRVRPELRLPFAELGDRLTKQGKERVTFVGTLNRAGDSQSVTVECEFPHRLRVVGQSGVLISFNARSRDDQPLVGIRGDLVETLFYDSPEYFFLALTRGAAIRSLGTRTSLSEELQAGPFYDVYQLTDEIISDNAARSRGKQYFFNSDTQLLELIRYVKPGNDQPVAVEVRVRGWRQVQGQRVPTQIVRLENGQRVLSLNFTAVNIGPRNEGSGSNSVGVATRKSHAAPDPDLATF